ncbi:MAG: acetate--CoA ligase family protein [Pseudomonadota bacterium]
MQARPTRDLSRLLRPRSIAVIGGLEAERVIEQCDKLAFPGRIAAVNRRGANVGGRAAVDDVTRLGFVPDAAFVAVNRHASVEVVAALARLGCGGVISYAAGFAEVSTDDEDAGGLQQRLVDAAGCMPLVGPNCYGIVNALDGVALWPDQHGLVPVASGVAIVAQSSNITISMTMQTRALPIAYAMTVGNQAQTGLSELGLTALADERVTALGLYIEGLDDVGQFEQLAMRARELGKPIVVIKVGRSAAARAAALTHTASLAGSHAGFEALCTRLGIAQVNSLDAFLETLKLFHCGGALSGNRLLSMSCSGGEASLMADAIADAPLEYPPFDAPQADALRELLGDIVTVANPFDYNTFIWGDWDAMTDLFEHALRSRPDLAMLVLDFPRADRCGTDDWDHALDAFLRGVARTGTRAAVIATMLENMPERVAARLLAAGVTPLCGIPTAIEAATSAAAVGAAWKRPLPLPLAPASAIDGTPVVLSEHEAKARLSRAGVNTPQGWLISGHQDLVQTMANDPPNRREPYVMKATGIAHKTEHGALRMNLRVPAEVAHAYAELSALSSTCLLEQQVEGAIAELLVGVTREPGAGLLLTVAAGGQLAELFQERAQLLLPTTRIEIDTAVGRLHVAKVLKGYRNAEPADWAGLVDQIERIAAFAGSHADTLIEIDVNPLLVRRDGAVAVDALIVESVSD